VGYGEYHAAAVKPLDTELTKMLLNDSIKSTFKDAAKKLTGHQKRDFMAKVTVEYLEGSARTRRTGVGMETTECAIRVA